MHLDLPHNIDDRFTLIAELGHGAHAIVYRALDRSLGREVAIKVLRAELVDSDVNERFRREIRLTSQLEHPHIAHVYDTGEFMGAPYFVTAIARGASLAERLERERQLPVDEALSIAREVASALEHAHKAGIVHRDVKPANILLTPDGALLTDFGVARALEAMPGTLATSTGVAVGTLLYMSPEQLCAEKGIDGRSDQYSLALVLYEMLAGVSAHVAANAEGLRALRIAAQHTPISRLRSSVPQHVEAALSRALASAPADRFREVGAFSEAIRSNRVVSANQSRLSDFATMLAPFRTRRSRAVMTTIFSTAVLIGSWKAFQLARSTSVSSSGSVTPRFSHNLSINTDDSSANHARLSIAIEQELAMWPGVATNRKSSTVVRSVPVYLRYETQSDGVRAFASLRRNDASIQDASVVFPSHGSLSGDSLRAFAGRILFASMISPDSADLPGTILTRATTDVENFASGWRSLLAGDLEKAYSFFASASRSGSLPQAALWRVISRAWLLPTDTDGWQFAAQTAESSVSALSTRDSLIAASFQLRASDRAKLGCDLLERATRLDAKSFVAWFSLGQCLQFDSLVVRDVVSPSRIRFETSWWAASRAYEEAIARLPSASLAPLFVDLPRVTLSLNATRRSGLLSGDGSRVYLGFPSASGDSVDVFPIAKDRFEAAGYEIVPRTYQRAIRLGRRRLLQLSGSLAELAPNSAVAQLEYGRALEYNGILTAELSEASALSALTRASALARTRHDSLEIGLTEARVHLRLGDFAAVRVIANRLLKLQRALPAEDAGKLASLALLVGARVVAETLVVRQYTASARREEGLPPSIAAVYAGYVVASATGSCANAKAMRRKLVQALQTHFAPEEVSRASDRWLSRADWLLLTCTGASLPSGAARDDPVFQAILAVSAHDSARAVSGLETMWQVRAGAAQSAVSWDTRFLEIWVLLQSNNRERARERIKAAFDELSSTMDYVLFDLGQGASLRRTLELCTALAWPEAEQETSKFCVRALNALGN